MLYIQEQLRQVYGPSNIHSYVQSPSTEVSLHIVLLPCHVFDYLFVDRLQNLTVERIWVEVNSRINYPIKRVLIMMREGQEIEMTDPLTKFCVSFIACNIAWLGCPSS